MRRALAAAAFLAAAAALWAPPAQAIETASFGLEPAGSAERTALHPEVKPGKKADDAVRLWNKTNAPIAVRLHVQGASLDGAGQVSLGGNGGAAQWITLAQPLVQLGPGQSVDVPVVVRAPREMPAGESTAAIVAEAEPPGGTANVAVVQRVALMVYASAPAGSSLSAPLGWAMWVAVALLCAVAAWMVVVRRRRSVVAAGHVDGQRLKLGLGVGR